MRNGKGSDIDELGKTILVAYVPTKFALFSSLTFHRYLGIDAARRWFHDTGSSFD